MTGREIANRLREERVVSFKMKGNGNFRAIEECDKWYSEELTPEELRIYANYLADLSMTKAFALDDEEVVTDEDPRKKEKR